MSDSRTSNATSAAEQRAAHHDRAGFRVPAISPASFGLSHVKGECAPPAKRDLEAHPCFHFSRALAHSQRRLVTVLTHPAQTQRTTLPTPSRSRSSFCSIRAPLAGSRISTNSSQRAAHDALPRACVRCSRRARVPRVSDLLRRDLGDLALYSAMSVSAMCVSVRKSACGSDISDPV